MFLKRNKWKLKLYYNGVLIKTKYINENLEPKEMVIPLRVFFKKRLFHFNYANILVRPTRLLKNDEDNKTTYWGCINEIGVEL